MPERERVAERLAERVLGGPWVWDGRTGEIEPGQGVTTEQYNAMVEQVGELYDQAANIINWRRILESAAGRHSWFNHEDKLDASWGVPTNVCAECIQAAVKDRERLGARWDKVAEAEGVDDPGARPLPEGTPPLVVPPSVRALRGDDA